MGHSHELAVPRHVRLVVDGGPRIGAERRFVPIMAERVPAAIHALVDVDAARIRGVARPVLALRVNAREAPFQVLPRGVRDAEAVHVRAAADLEVPGVTEVRGHGRHLQSRRDDDAAGDPGTRRVVDDHGVVQNLVIGQAGDDLRGAQSPKAKRVVGHRRPRVIRDQGAVPIMSLRVRVAALALVDVDAARILHPAWHRPACRIHAVEVPPDRLRRALKEAGPVDTHAAADLEVAGVAEVLRELHHHLARGRREPELLLLGAVGAVGCNGALLHRHLLQEPRLVAGGAARIAVATGPLQVLLAGGHGQPASRRQHGHRFRADGHRNRARVTESKSG
mmetsp:Transcript_89097/g.272858  ORF Transcript_89097/g.272858 Transcript_89097/m.272858 type:complete len:336 (+) Transcript_89097:313-1320(+)